MSEPRPASQDDIDALLAEVAGVAGVSKPAAPAPAAPAAAAPAKPADLAGATTADIGQGDIDALLAEITKSADQQQPGPLTKEQTKRLDAVISKIQGATVVPETGLGLTPQDLDQLVAKHAAPEPPAAETMISQQDIDALVQQLSAAVGGGTVPVTATVPSSVRITAPAARKPAAQAAPAAKAAAPAPAKGASPAPAKPGSGSKPAANPTAPAPGMASGGAAALTAPGLIPVLAPAELRGARWLLVAAVVLLGICAIAMGSVVQTVGRLSRDLTRTETQAPIDADQFALALTAARSQLASSDDFEAAQGVEQIKQLRERFPTRTFELTLELARHWRGRQAHRKAADEYAAIIDRVIAQPSDPRLLLENAGSLAEIGDTDGAIRLLYVLLAHERLYLANEDNLGHTRPAEDTQRDRLAVQQAYLLLGELLSRQAAAPAAGEVHGADAHGETAHAASGEHAAPVEHAAPAAHDGGHH